VKIALGLMCVPSTKMHPHPIRTLHQLLIAGAQDQDSPQVHPLQPGEGLVTDVCPDRDF
jgi:hypothetical protein